LDRLRQGDRIGRIFAWRTLVFSRQFFYIIEEAQNYRLLFSKLKLCIKDDKNRPGNISADFSHQLVRSHCSATALSVGPVRRENLSKKMAAGGAAAPAAAACGGKLLCGCAAEKWRRKCNCLKISEIV
jgi:hypothetical protein